MDERADSAWWIAAPALVWLLHFNAVYAVVAVGCARWPHAAVHAAVVALTVAAAGALGGTALRGWRRHRRAPEASLARWIALATVLVSATAAMGLAYVAASAVLVGGCA